MKRDQARGDGWWRYVTWTGWWFVAGTILGGVRHENGW